MDRSTPKIKEIYLSELPDRAHDLLIANNMPAIGEKITVRNSDGGIKKGELSGFVYGGMIIKNYKQAGLVIGFLADAAILAYLFISIRSIGIFPDAGRL